MVFIISISYIIEDDDTTLKILSHGNVRAVYKKNVKVKSKRIRCHLTLKL